MPDPNALVVQILTAAPIFLFSLVFHEYAHAAVANRLGDRLAAWTGRLTLDPRAHLDPVGSIFMPVAGIAMGWATGGYGFIFGWAKPVPVNPRDLRNGARDMAMIALAGPVSNLLLMAVCAFTIRGMVAVDLQPTGLAGLGYEMAAFGIYINALLALFNMIPLPPLDGSKVLAWLLGERIGARLLGFNAGLSFLLIMFLVFQGYLTTPLLFVMALGQLMAGVPIGPLLG